MFTVEAAEAASVLKLTPAIPRRSFWRSHGYILPSVAISIFICAWFVTWGDWNFFEREEFCGFYDAQARSILQGRLDVPREAIGKEAFTFENKAYGYFGIAPSLLRIPLVLIFERMDGRWSRLMMLLACTINLFCAYRILQSIRGNREVNSWTQRALHSLFILCVGIGSTNVFLTARSYTFHEAIMWSATFGLLFTTALMSYFARPRLRTLLLAAFFAFMALHSRATIGAGTLLALCALSVMLFSKKQRQHAVFAAVAAIIIVSSYFAVNYAKFRTFDGVPLKYYDFGAQRPVYLKLTGGRQIHLENIPTTVATYFGFRGLWFDPRFPWLFPSRDAVVIGSPAIVEIEGFSTFPVSMPALMSLAVVGILALVRNENSNVRRMRLPVICLFLGGAIMFATVAITERYLHDLYPALVICAAVGVSKIEGERAAPALTSLIAVLSAISIAVNCSFALENQRLDFWGMGGVAPAKQAEFKQMQRSVYKFFHR